MATTQLESEDQLDESNTIQIEAFLYSLLLGLVKYHGPKTQVGSRFGLELLHNVLRIIERLVVSSTD